MMDAPPNADEEGEDDDKTAAKQFLLKSAARTLDSAFEGPLSAECLVQTYHYIQHTWVVFWLMYAFR